MADTFRFSDLSRSEASSVSATPTFSFENIANPSFEQPGGVQELSLIDEFGRGVSSGVDSLQSSLFGVAALAGRELGLESLQDFGLAGVERNQAEASEFPTSTPSLGDIESVGDFFRFAAGGLGQALPSLTTAVATGGIGGVIAKKAVERKLREVIANRALRTMKRKGFDDAVARPAVARMLSSPEGRRMLIEGTSGGTSNAQLITQAFARGASRGAIGSAAVLQTGEVDISLTEAGKDAGFTSIVAGVLGGALEGIPALRLLDKMFPGVDTAVSKAFVKDLAIASGTQALLEGGTEAAQEMISIAALAYHDPSFDIFTPENALRVADSFAIGAIVGGVTGAGAQAFGDTSARVRPGPVASNAPNLPTYRFEGEPETEFVDPDFKPSDTSLWQDIRTKIGAAIGETIDPAINNMRNQVEESLTQMDLDFGGTLNNQGNSFTEMLSDAHNRFVEQHRADIDRLRKFSFDASKEVYNQARTILDPKARAEFIRDGINRVKERAQTVADTFRTDSDTTIAGISTQVDDISDMGDLFGDREAAVEGTTQGAEELEARAEVGEVEAPIKSTFGKTNARDEDAQGFKTKSLAEKKLVALKKRFPSVPESAWELNEVNGLFFIEIRSPEGNRGIVEDDITNSALEDARNSARDNPESNRPRSKIPSLTGEGETLIDLETLSRRGRSLNPQESTRRQGLIDILGRLMERGEIERADFNRAVRTFDEFNPRERQPDETIRLRDDINEPRDRENAARNRELDKDFVDPDDFQDTKRVTRRDAQGKIIGQETARTGSEESRITVRGTEQVRVGDDPTSASQQRDFSEEASFPSGDPRITRTQKILEDTDPDADDPIVQSGPTEEQQARQSARQPGTTPVTRVPKPKPKPKPTTPVTVSLSESTQNKLGSALQALLERFAKLLSKPGSQVTVIEGTSNFKEDVARVKADPNVSSTVKSLMENLDFQLATIASPALVHYDIFTGQTTIWINDFGENTGAKLGALVHELGHAIHWDSWASLNRAEQDALWEAFQKDRAAGRTTGAAIRGVATRTDNAPADLTRLAPSTVYEFREWMADQFLLWTQGRSKPKGALKSFFEKVGVKLQELYDFIQKNPGRLGKLNETYVQFADAVAKKSVGLNPPGVNYWLREGAAGTDVIAMTDPFSVMKEVETLAELQQLPRDSREADVVGAGIARIPTKQLGPLKERVDAFPAIVKNAAIRFNQWVRTAYKLALAPANGVIRDIGKRVPVAIKIANIFARNIGKPKDGSNYHDRVQIMQHQFRTRFEDITSGMTEVQKDALAVRLAELDSTDGKPANLRERQMRKLFDDMLVYLRQQGLPVAEVNNYFPRQFNYEQILLDEKEIIAHLRASGFEQEDARAFYNTLVSPEMRDWGSLGRQTPAFRNMRSRSLTDKFFDKYQSTSLDGIVSNYISSAVKRAEYNSFLGEKAPKGATKPDKIPLAAWDPKGKLMNMLDQARDEGATDEDIKTIKMFIDANLGQLGRDSLIAKKGRTAMAALVAYQNVRVLMFTVFASLPDMVGPAIRAGSMKDAFQSVSKNMSDIVGRDPNKLQDMARAWGIVSSEASNHIMTEYVDNNYMPPGLRRMNEAFFKYTGLNWYTDFTRKAALAVGRDYIQTMAGRSVDQSIPSKERLKAKAALAELGLSKEHVDRWAGNGQNIWGGGTYQKENQQQTNSDRLVAEGLTQFVNESIMRPNASQRPILASHPGAMLIFHLKGYMYAMGEVVGKRLIRNFNLADTPYQTAAAIAPALAMLALTALGLELREIMQFAFTGRTPPSDRQDAWDYTWNIMERSGLLAQGQLAVDGANADLAFLAGPTIDQLADFVGKPASFNVPRAIPIISQMPSLRNIVE